MTPNEKGLWGVVASYAALLGLSAFVIDPNWRVGGIASNLLFWMVGPTIGTALLAGATLILMISGKISVTNGVTAILFLIAVSVVCLAFTIPMMMSI